MGYADLHIHTIHSYDGTASVEAVLWHTAYYTDLDVIAITDHDSISGIEKAMDLAPYYGIDVIPGCEVSTADGHLLALFIQHPVPDGYSLIKTVELIGEQGGICIAAHPNAIGVSSLRFSTIQNALEHAGISQVLVGVEAFNGGLLANKNNAKVESLARTLPLAQTGNSDSHILETIGCGSTEFAGCTAQDLRQALISATTKVRKNPTSLRFGFISHYLPRLILQKVGMEARIVVPEIPASFFIAENSLENQIN
jgi:predicted metal-dependent phosphoesterase TrpH